MNSRTRLFGLNTLLAISLLLTACGTPTPPPTPTMDVNALFTQAAQTVVAQMTANAPTVTPTKAATNTPLPTFTPLGGALPTLPPLSTLPALATATKQGFTGPDKAVYITQSPSDYGTVKTGQVFNITWRVQNTGTTTWNQNYAYRFYSAINNIPTSANGYNLTATVAPGAYADLTVVATAPSTPGTYDTRWVLTNANGENFSSFDLTITVVQGASSSSAGPTETGEPNACDAIQTVDSDYNFSGAATTITLNLTGGQVKFYVDVTTDIAGGSLIYTYTNLDTGAIEAQNTATLSTDGYITFGNPNKGYHELKLEGSTTNGTINVSGIKSVSSNSTCW